MDRGAKFITYAIVIISAVVLQAILIIAQKNEMPSKAAIEFTKAYFNLDRTMAELLCNQIGEEAAGDVVDTYLNRVADQARSMGFGLNYMKNTLSHIETKTEMEDANTATVRVTALRKRYLNPLYGIVAQLFFLTETHAIDETLTLIREDGRWKVCGTPFTLVEL